MASVSAAYAAGGMQPSASDDSLCGTKKPKKKKLWLNNSLHRPLYVAEVQYKSGKYFNRAKKSLMVLYGARMLVLDVSELESAEDIAALSQAMPVGTLRYLSYADVIDATLVEDTTLKVRHSTLSSKPKLSSVWGMEATSPRPDGSSTSTDSLSDSSRRSTNLETISMTSMARSEACSTTSAVSGGPASLRMSYESFSLQFKDTAAAEAAAAALLYQRAQHAAAEQWLQQGLHAGFRCEPVSLHAIPMEDSGTRQQHGSLKAQASSLQLVPWGSVKPGSWGSTVPLPAGWQRYLAAAAAQTADAVADEPMIMLEDLACPADILQGPAALQFCFSTPLGLATATIQPQHVRAAMLSTQCQQVLAVPMGNTASPGHRRLGTPAGFRWTVESMVPVATAASISAVSSRSNSKLSLLDTAVADSAASSPTASAAARRRVTASHTTEVFAAVTIEVVNTPYTAGAKGISSFGPARSASAATATERPIVHVAAVHEGDLGCSAKITDGSTVRTAQRPTAHAPERSSLEAVVLHLGVYSVLALIPIMQMATSPILAMLQLLLVAALSAWTLHSAHSRQVSTTPNITASSSSAAPAAASSAASAEPAAADIADSHTGSTTEGDAGMTCCGWSIRLVAGDVISSPSRYLQLQISMATAEEGLVKLRQRIASVSVSCGGAICQLPPKELDLPMLISDPEPAWLTVDTKQRFLNFNSSIDAARSQAQRTHKWRLQMDIDNVLCKPCPWYGQVLAALPTYLLAERTADGNAVVLTEVGRVKDLCDLVFKPPAGTKGVSLLELEHTLAVLNEYLVKVAAPGPLPGGGTVRIFDMQGFKLSYVMGDIVTLFKVLVRMVTYYPDRLVLALIINTPGWFAYPWKLLSSFLDANTRARVMVVGAPSAALAAIAHHMGGLDKVHVAWGGQCTVPLTEYPSHKQMMKFAANLNTALAAPER